MIKQTTRLYTNLQSSLSTKGKKALSAQQMKEYSKLFSQDFSSDKHKAVARAKDLIEEYIFYPEASPDGEDAAE
jgi:hypothetical protein